MYPVCGVESSVVRGRVGRLAASGGSPAAASRPGQLAQLPLQMVGWWAVLLPAAQSIRLLSSHIICDIILHPVRTKHEHPAN